MTASGAFRVNAASDRLSSDDSLHTRRIFDGCQITSDLGGSPSLFSVSEQPTQETKAFAAFDAAGGEAMGYLYGPAGIAVSVAYNKAGGTQALARIQTPAFNAQVLATANWMCMFGGGH